MFLDKVKPIPAPSFVVVKQSHQPLTINNQQSTIIS